MSADGRRRFALFARSRRTPLVVGLLALFAVAAGLLLARADRPGSVLALAATLPLAWAAAVGMGVASPFGEAERAAAYPLPRLRLVHLLVVLAAGALTLLAGSAAGAGDGWQVLLRNGAGFAGLALLAAWLVGAEHAWAPPLVALLIGTVAGPWEVPLAGWWGWPVAAAERAAAALVAGGLLAVGVGVVVAWGARSPAVEVE